MSKPRLLNGYNADIADECERVLVTLFRGLGPWKDSVFLVGGLAPRYLVKARPPKVPPHAGTGDIDVVIDIGILADTQAYRTLEANLKGMGFTRASNDKGILVNWRWRIETEHELVVILEFLADNPETKGGALQELPSEGAVTAINIPHASIVFDLHDRVDLTAELLAGGGWATETIPYVNIVSFTCLKAFAFDHRHERKDAHDLIYCLEYAAAEWDEVISKFTMALEGRHGPVVRRALTILRDRFCDRNPDEGYLREGPVAVARFELGDEDDAYTAEQRALRQRQVNDVIERLLTALGV